MNVDLNLDDVVRCFTDFTAIDDCVNCRIIGGEGGQLFTSLCLAFLCYLHIIYTCWVGFGLF